MSSSFYAREAANDSFIVNLENQSELKLEVSIKQGEINFSQVIAIATEKEEQKQRCGEITKQTLSMFHSRVNSNISEYFGPLKTSDITSKVILGFIEYLSDKSIKAVTINQYLGLLKRLLTIAVLEGWIEGLPVFPKVRSKSIPRASLSIDEYLEVLRCAKNMSRPNMSTHDSHRNIVNGFYVKDAPIPKEMVWLVGFMTNTFLRPVDMKLLQHKHIKIVEGKNRYLKISLPETKRHTGQVISLRAAVRIYRELRENDYKRGFGNSNDYVFLPQIKNREVAIQAISFLFRRILLKANLESSSDGQKRTLYSLRHTAITFRLIYGQGIDLLTLARNARTSVEMIEKFYSSNLKAEMNVDMLQSKRTKLG